MANHSHDNEAHGKAAIEASEISLGPLIKFAIGLTILTVVTYYLMLFMFNYLEARAQREDGPLPAMATERQVIPPAPRLQLAPTEVNQKTPHLLTDHPLKEYAQYDREEQRKLTTYEWIDEKQGIVRLPIEKAKALVLERSELVSRPPATEATGGKKVEPAESEPATAAKGAKAGQQ